MTTPHPPEPDPHVTCPGCLKPHAPHPELGVWCTRACIEARLHDGAVLAAPAKPKRRGATK